MKVVIVGGGQVGSYMASLLLSGGHEFCLIENRETVFTKIQNEFPANMLLYGSGTDPKMLERAGISSADVVAAVTGADEVNLVVSTLSKMEFGVQRVVARVNNPKNKWLFNSGMGVDVGVNQADIMAHFVVERMNLNDMLTIFKLNRDKYSIVQMKVQQDAVVANKTVKELSVPKDSVLISVIRDETLFIPNGDTQILVDDEILVLTNEANKEKLEELFL